MWLSIDTFQILMSCAAFIVSACLYWMLSPTFFINVYYLVLFLYSCLYRWCYKKRKKKLIIQTQAPVNLITPSTERQTVFKLDDTITSGLIGTTTVRQRIQREIQTSYDESLIAEQEKDEKRDQIEGQQIRQNRVLQEPDVQDDHIVISIRHPALTTRHQFFRDDAKMNNVYDWVESLSPEPMFWRFFCNKTNAASKHSIWRK